MFLCLLNVDQQPTAKPTSATGSQVGSLFIGNGVSTHPPKAAVSEGSITTQITKQPATNDTSNSNGLFNNNYMYIIFGVSVTFILLCCIVITLKSLRRKKTDGLPKHEMQIEMHESIKSMTHSVTIPTTPITPITSQSKDSRSKSNELVVNLSTSANFQRVSSIPSTASHASDMQVMDDGELVTGRELFNHNQYVPGSPQFTDMIIEQDEDDIIHVDTMISNGEQENVDDIDDDMINEVNNVTIGGDEDKNGIVPPPPPPPPIMKSEGSNVLHGIDTAGNDDVEYDEEIILENGEFVVEVETDGHLD